jgi:SAM-dependent methyltransferase
MLLDKIKILLRPLYSVINIFLGALLWYSPWRKKFMLTLFREKKNRFESMFSFFVMDYLFYTDVPKYRKLIVANEPGNQWCDIYRSRTNEYEKKLSWFFEALEKLIDSYRLTQIMQIGCAGGGELYYLAKRFPQIKFIGIDLNKNAIDKNRELYKDISNIEFISGDIFTENFLNVYRPQLVFTSGTAEYFTEEELRKYIDSAKKEGVNIMLFYEPITISSFNYKEDTRSKPRGGMAFNHNYSFHMNQFDFQVSEDFENWPAQPQVLMVKAVGVRKSKLV